MRDYHGCSICGRKFPEDALTLFAGDYFCEHCLDEETIVCADCGTRLWNDSNAGSDDHPLCQRCYDSSYTTCERCGRLLLYDDACYLNNGDEDYPYCESCYGGIMNPASALMWAQSVNWKLLLSYYMTGIPVDLARAAATFFFLWLGSEPMLEKLDRIQTKYGLAA